MNIHITGMHPSQRSIKAMEIIETFEAGSSRHCLGWTYRAMDESLIQVSHLRLDITISFAD